MQNQPTFHALFNSHPLSGHHLNLSHHSDSGEIGILSDQMDVYLVDIACACAVRCFIQRDEEPLLKGEATAYLASMTVFPTSGSYYIASLVRRVASKKKIA